VIGAVYTDYGNTDRVTAAAFELRDLIPKIIDDAIDLLDHRFGQHFYLDTDLHGCDGTTGHQISGIDDWSLARNNLPEGPIAAPGSDATAFVLYVEDAVFPVHHSVDQFWRSVDRYEVFVQMHRYEIALIRRAMLV
jgi:hypothetical protein